MKSFFNYAKNRFLYNLLKIIGLVLLGFIASNFLLINTVYAETVYGNEFTAVLFDNNNGYLTGLSAELNNYSWTGKVGFIANSSGAAWGFNLKSAMIKGHTYTLSMDISTQNASGSDIVFSTYNRIGLGTSLSSAVSSYQNSTNTELIYTNNVNGILQFAFKANENGSYLVVPFCTSYSINSETIYFSNFVLEDLGSSSDVNQDTINSSLNNQTNEINNSITNSENNIKDSINSTEDNIKNGIKDGFENCSSFSKKFTFNDANVLKSYLYSNGTLGTGPDWGIVEYFSIYKNIDYTFQVNKICTNCSFCLYDSNKDLISCTAYLNQSSINFNSGNATYFSFSIAKDSTLILSAENVCVNRIDDTNNKLDEAENTRKGIWETIKSIPSTIGNFFTDLGNKISGFFKELLEGIIQALKDLFIPGENYFSTWYNDFKDYMEQKLGFLLTPFSIFIDFIETYSNLSSSSDIVINIPDITVPNFEEHKIVSATSFNWSQTLKSKTSLLNLWNLYLDFIDVFLILNFIGLCEKTYNRIFGGDTSNYEYYTTEDTYNVDVKTGEVLSSKHKEKTTHRKKVDE